MWLTEACGSQALQLFIDLLRDAQNITDNNYSHYSNQSIAEHSYPPSDIFEALLIAVRQSSEILIRGHAMGAGEVFALLRREPADIFVRLALHALSLDPSSAPELATAQLVQRSSNRTGVVKRRILGLGPKLVPVVECGGAIKDSPRH